MTRIITKRNLCAETNFAEQREKDFNQKVNKPVTANTIQFSNYKACAVCARICNDSGDCAFCISVASSKEKYVSAEAARFNFPRLVALIITLGGFAFLVIQLFLAYCVAPAQAKKYQREKLQKRAAIAAMETKTR